MFTQTYVIGPYNPVLEPEQRVEAARKMLGVQDGYNFAWRAGSVFAAHSYEVKTAVAPNTADRHSGDFIINNKQVFCFQDGIYEFVAGMYVPLYGFNLPQVFPKYDLQDYKWTYAYVGTTHYFSHPAVSHIIWYDEKDDNWGEFRDPCWTGPVFGITHADNRHVVLLQDVVTWSEFDRGLLFTNDWYCGSGAQSLALIRYGQPYGVWPYRNSWLTLTSKGIMYSEAQYQGGPNPAHDDQIGGTGMVTYHHEEVSFDDLPLGPSAIEHIDEKSVVWLGRKGFHQFAPVQGGGTGAVQPWQTEMGLFYSERVIPRRIEDNTRRLDNFALNYARDIGWLFVSSRREGATYNHYDRAHVHQFDLDRWGSFNHDHIHFGFGRHEEAAKNPHYGFIDSALRYCIVDHTPREYTSWVKCTPHRFVAPNEDVSPNMLSSVQSLRVGVSKPAWEQTYKADLASSWFEDKQIHENIGRFDVIVAAGNDSNVAAGDESEYAYMVHRDDQIASYSCHTTGSDHTIFFIARGFEYHFDISHIEVGFFYSGVK